MIAFSAGVHFAVGDIDFELLLEWLVNKHKRRRVVGQTICSCNAFIAFGQECLLQLDVLILNSGWSRWCRGGGGW